MAEMNAVCYFDSVQLRDLDTQRLLLPTFSESVGTWMIGLQTVERVIPQAPFAHLWRVLPADASAVYGRPCADGRSEVKPGEPIVLCSHYNHYRLAMANDFTPSHLARDFPLLGCGLPKYRPNDIWMVEAVKKEAARPDGVYDQTTNQSSPEDMVRYGTSCVGLYNLGRRTYLKLPNHDLQRITIPGVSAEFRPSWFVFEKP